MAAIRKRGNSYQIRVYCGTDINGKKIMKTKSFTPDPKMTPTQVEKELNRQATLFEDECRKGLILDNNITFADFVELWRKDYAENNLKAKTLDAYDDLLSRVLPAIGHIKLADLKPIHLVQLYKNLSENNMRRDVKYTPGEEIIKLLKQQKLVELSKKTGISTTTLRSVKQGKNASPQTATILMNYFNDNSLFTTDENQTLSGKTILKYHRVISSVLTTAVQWQFIYSNPCQRLKPPKAEYTEAKYLDNDDLSLLISALDDEPIKYRTAIMMLIVTGCRRGELLGLEWSDVDFKHQTVNINKELIYIPGKGLFDDTPKNATSNREIKLSSGMINMLHEWETEQLKQRLALGSKWENSSKIFTNDFGQAMRPDTMTQWFSKFIARHNLPPAHLHTLRHTSASLLIADGTDVRTVSKRLGHANTSTTLNIYAHAIKSADEAAAEKLNKLFTRDKKTQ